MTNIVSENAAQHLIDVYSGGNRCSSHLQGSCSLLAKDPFKPAN